MNLFPRLSFDGYMFLFALNDATDLDVTADGLAGALDEAVGSVGCAGCAGCGSQEDTRYGWCFRCTPGDTDV